MLSIITSVSLEERHGRQLVSNNIQSLNELEASLRFANTLKKKTGRNIFSVHNCTRVNYHDCDAIEGRKKLEIEVTQLTKLNGHESSLWSAIENKLERYYQKSEKYRLFLLVVEYDFLGNPRLGQTIGGRISKMLAEARLQLGSFAHQPFDEIWYLGLDQDNSLQRDYTVRVWPTKT